MELAEEGARGFANPNRPDEETVERHNLTHLPAAAWCDICVRTRGRGAPHREAEASKIDAVRPVIEMDYAEQGMSNQPHDNVKALIAIDRSSGAIYASGVMQKGDDGGYVTQSLSVWIASLGYTMVTLHSDKEPAICWVRDRVQANLTERGMSVTTRASPTHSHASNGGAERAVQSVLGSNVGSTSGRPYWAHLWSGFTSLVVGVSTCWLDFDTVWSSSRHWNDSLCQTFLQTVTTTIADVCGSSDRSETWSADQQTRASLA